MTHNERVLNLLSDGEPHSHHELYALFVVAHSRISELRKRGYRIERWQDEDTHWYRLLGEGSDASPGMAGRTPECSAPLSEQPEAVCDDSGQLVLGGVA